MNNADTYGLLVTQIGAPVIPSGSSYITSTTKYVGNLYEVEDSRVTRYIFLGSTRVAAITGTEVDIYHNDHLGSVNAVSDNLGSLRSLTEYDPFGKVSRFERYGSKIKTGWQGFNGKPLDDETGLLFYGARYYDPSLGRFITPDTVVQAPSNPQTLNRYTYCNNNPVNLIDPTGHSWFSKLFKAVGQFITNLVKNPIQTILSVITIAVGVFTVNPFLIASGALQFVNIGTSSWQGGGWSVFHQTAGYTSIALAAAGAFYSPASAGSAAPSAEGGYDSAGSFDLGTLIITGKEYAEAANLTEIGNAASGIVAGIQTGLTVAGMVPGAGAGFDVANAGISAVRGDWSAAGLSLAATIPFVGIGANAERLGIGIFQGTRAEAGFARIGRGTSQNQINKLIQTGRAPRSVLRVDGSPEKVHVHFDDDSALYIDGTWKHGYRDLTRKETEFLKKHGWDL